MSLGRSNLQTQLTAWLMRRTAPSGVRRVAPLAAAVATDVGEVRRENQDRISIARGRDRLGRPFVVAALADGIGGMRQGADCAALALGSLLATVASEATTSIDVRQWLFRGMHQANTDVHARMHGEGGSTISAALILGSGSLHWASVGDSRVYVGEGSLLNRISTDDTIAGQLGRDSGAGFDQSNLIQFIGIGKSLEAGIYDLAYHEGATLLLTTDGVHFLDSTPWFAKLVKHASDPGVCVRRLVELSRWCGGPDNATAAMLSLGRSIDEGMPQVDGCLEVWDPFGELLVIVEPMRTATAPAQQSEPILSETAPTPSLYATPVASEAPPPPAEPEEAKAVVSAKRRSARKAKAAPKSQQVEKSQEKAAVPQLLIEFPNKTT